MARLIVRVLHRRGNGLALMSYNGEEALWVRRISRKAGTCCMTGKPFGKGDRVYGPVGNQMYRFERALEEAVLSAVLADTSPVSPPPPSGS